MSVLTIYAIGALACGIAALFRSPTIPRHWPLLACAAVPQLGTALGVHIPGMLYISAACVGAWAMANRRTPGLALAAVGMLLNALPMALHGGRMPVAAGLLSGAEVTVGASIAHSKDVIVAGSPLIWLSDHIALVWGGVGLIASPGDLIVTLGIIWWLLRSPESQRSGDNARTAPDPGARIAPPAIPPRR